MKRELTCIVCPVGCCLEVRLENGRVLSVTGNTCPRGVSYAESECTAPKRTVTTTMRCDNGMLLPVKTDKSIPKEKVMECMKIINSSVAHLPVSVGDVIIESVFDAKVVATKNMGGTSCE